MKTIQEIICGLLDEEGVHNISFVFPSKKITITKDKFTEDGITRAANHARSLFGINKKVFTTLLSEDEVFLNNSEDLIEDKAKFDSINWEETNPFFMPLWGTWRGTFPFDLVKPEHFMPAILKGIENTIEEVNRITKNPETPSYRNTISYGLEESYEPIYKRDDDLLDLVNSILSVYYYNNCTDEIEKLEQDKIEPLSKLDAFLSYNKEMYERLIKVREGDKEIVMPETKRLLDKMIESFERNGINLSKSDQEKLTEIRKSLELYEQQFDINTRNDSNTFELIVKSEDELSGVPKEDIARFKKAAEEKGYKNCWLLNATRNTATAILENADNRDLRKAIYIKRNTLCQDGEFNNVELLKSIVNSRIDIINIFKTETYADRILHNRMIGNKEDVNNFLSELVKYYKEPAKKEFNDICTFAKSIEGEDFDLMPWDMTYYAKKLETELFKIDSDKFKPYFEYNRVEESLFWLANKLYGITFCRIELQTWGEDVRAFEVLDRDSSYLGMLYIDPFTNKHKAVGAWCDVISDQYLTGFNGLHNHRPWITISTNFNKGEHTLLNFDEVQTLLHEFGHSLQGLLSMCVYSEQSCMRVSRDYVELASQFMENFAYEDEFLDHCAIHFETGEKLPKEMIESLKDRSKYLAATHTIRQLQYGITDMAWNTLKEKFNGNPIEFEKSIVGDLCFGKQIPNKCHSLSFTHIFSGGYASGYYGYKWAEMLDADAFSLFKEKGIFDQETAEKFRKYILSSGSTQDAMDLYIKFRGRKPNLEALLMRTGIK